MIRLLWILVLIVPCSLEGTVKITSTPEWVVDIDSVNLDASVPDAFAGDVFHLVYNRQYKEQDTFLHTVYRLLNTSALQDLPSLNIHFREDGMIFLHRFDVIRNGKRINHLSAKNMKIFSNEESSYVSNGDRTVRLLADSLKVGDTIDLAFTRRNGPTIFSENGHYSYWLPLRRGHDVLYHSLQVHTQKNMVYRLHKGFSSNYFQDDIKQILQDKRDIRLWNVKRAIAPNNLVPAGVVDSPVVELSTMRSWKDYQFVAKYYEFSDALPADLLIPFRRQKDQRKLFNDIVKFVQDKIRYYGKEEGVWGHKPRSPLETLKRGYGDCKDKSLLLVGLLNHFGFTAHVALVNSELGPDLNSYIPSTYSFDHAIVLAIVDGKDIWIDPTRSNVGDPAYLASIDNFGYAYVIKGDSDSLTKIPLVQHQEPLRDVSEELRWDAEHDRVVIAVTTIYRSDAADRFRVDVNRYGLREIGEQFRQFYANSYSGAEILKDMTLVDKLVDGDNKVITTEEYILAVKADNKGMVYFNSWGLQTLPRLRFNNYAGPVAVDPFIFDRHSIRTLRGIDYNRADSDSFTQGGIRYQRKVISEGDKGGYEYLIRTVANRSEASSYQEALERIENQGLSFKLSELIDGTLNASSSTSSNSKQALMYKLFEGALFLLITLACVWWGVSRNLQLRFPLVQRNLFRQILLTVSLFPYGLYLVVTLACEIECLGREVNEGDLHEIMRDKFLSLLLLLFGGILLVCSSGVGYLALQVTIILVLLSRIWMSVLYREFISKTEGHSKWWSYILVVILPTIYLQYLINKILERKECYGR